MKFEASGHLKVSVGTTADVATATVYDGTISCDSSCVSVLSEHVLSSDYIDAFSNVLLQF